MITEQIDSILTTEKTLRVLDAIHSKTGATQRSIAIQTGVSLGLVNIVLKRLLHTGAIKVTHLDGRKVRYMLTPEGFAEKARRTYTYFSRTAKIFRRHQQRCDSLIDALLKKNYRRFAILGDNEISALVMHCLRQRSTETVFRHVSATDETTPEEVLLDCRFENMTRPLGVRFLSQLLKTDGQALQVQLADEILNIGTGSELTETLSTAQAETAKNV